MASPYIQKNISIPDINFNCTEKSLAETFLNKILKNEHSMSEIFIVFVFVDLLNVWIFCDYRQFI